MVPAPLITTSFLIDLCENMVLSPKPTLTIHGPQEGGGGVLQISIDRDDQMGAKIKTQKNSMPIFQAIKISRGTYTARTHGNYQESSDCFEYPKKFLLKSSSPKKYLPKFSYPNKILKSKISNPKKSFDHPCHLKSRET